MRIDIKGIEHARRKLMKAKTKVKAGQGLVEYGAP